MTECFVLVKENYENVYGNGYSYSDGTDNRYYAEQIFENFYYYTESN